jgi:hypothetical protein
LKTVGRLLLVLLLASLLPACGGNGDNPKPPVTPATAPTTLVATSGSSGRIDLTWIDTSDNEFEFRIQRSDDGGTTYAQVGSSPMNTQAFSDAGLLPNKTYYYRVTAWNGAGNSPFAGPSNATTKSLAWKSTIGGPGIRAEHSAIYDSLGRRMILFGGQDDFFTYYNDVWSLDLLPTTATLTTPPTNHWAPLTPTGVPPSIRFGHSAIYDAQNNRMIVFGGQDDTLPPSASYRNDVHVLTLGTTPAWSQPAILGTPPSGRLGHSAVYDAAKQRMVVFGGNDAGSEKVDGFFLSLPLTPPFVWSSAPIGPIKRTKHSATYDGMRQQMIVFGGLDHVQLPDGSDLNSETWSFALAGTPVWTPWAFSGGTPSMRWGHSAVYDADNQRVVLFGGDTTFGPGPTANNELWSLQLHATPAWTFLSPNSGTPPPARWAHTAIYDSGSKRMVIYGGYDSSLFAAFQDTWILDF